jgi:CRISPR/Cas system-associated exonuclease Cas4 (RecB family)
MGRKNKLYFPKDEEFKNMFVIASTKEGLIISLNDFGYNGLHLTIFVKELNSEKSLLNIHLTKEGKNKKYLDQISFEFNNKELEARLIKRLESIKPNLEKWILNLKNNSIEKPQKAFCINCFINEKFDFDDNVIHSREKSSEFWNKMINEGERDLLEYIPKTSCSIKGHQSYFNPETGEDYFKIAGYFIEEERWSILQREFLDIFEDNFKEELEFTRNLFEKLEKKIKETGKENN